jgi:hypothetical protein
MSYGLGRHPATDERDEQHLMRELTRPLGALPTHKYWYMGPVLDQGDYPHCVGYSWRKFLEASPLNTKTGPSAVGIYHQAQRVDEWPGEDYDGTSVRAGAKVLSSLGHLAEYRWAWDLETAISWVLSRGPVVLGTTWYRSMFYPNEEGFIHPDGPSAGGHAYVLSGANRTRGVARIRNSWGYGWGQRGNAWLSFEDLERLILEDGEACTAIEKHV